MGADAHQPGDELTEGGNARLGRVVGPNDAGDGPRAGLYGEATRSAGPRLTEQLGQLCAIIADVMVKHEAMITAALTNTPTRQEMKQLVNDLARLLAGIADDHALPKAPAQRTEASREGHRNT